MFNHHEEDEEEGREGKSTNQGHRVRGRGQEDGAEETFATHEELSARGAGSVLYSTRQDLEDVILEQVIC